jgi:hypothetical protein
VVCYRLKRSDESLARKYRASRDDGAAKIPSIASATSEVAAVRPKVLLIILYLSAGARTNVTICVKL